MKKYLLCLAALLFAAASCSEKPEVENPEEIVPESTAAPVLYATFESNEIDSKAGFTKNGAYYEHYWTAGDHIYVFPKNKEYDIYSCTDASTGKFSLVKDRADGSAYGTIIAVYDSELVDDNNVVVEGPLALFTSPDRIYTKLSPEYTVDGPDNNGAYGYNNIMIAAAENVDETLVFKSAVGWLKLQLKGSQKVKAITLTANIENIVAGTTDDVSIQNLTSSPTISFIDGDSPNYKYRTLNISAPYAQLNNSTATDFYITLPPCTMSQGFEIRVAFADGTFWTMPTTAQPYEIKRNTVLKMPERTISTTISNLSSSGTANTYIVQSTGNKKFNASVKGCSGESVGTPVRAGVLWESYNTHETPSVGDIVKNVTYLDGYVYFNVPFTKKGNAVIAVYDSSDNILWSWLIWVNDLDLTTPDDLSDYVDGFKIMHHPLGAIVSADRGLYFQWGRKDPFYFCDEYGASDIKATGALTPSKSIATVSSGIANPTTFYYPSGFAWESTYDTSLWSDSSKTMHDPCPPGWKVMSGNKITAAIAHNPKFSNGAAGSGYFNPYGCLLVNNSGVLSYSTSNRYWTSAARTGGVNVVTSAINVDSGTLSVVDETGTAVGYQIRCEKL
ncbi:MAG: hypothetical protein IJM00_01560 [Bacteroidales bacterium]|nr:hypothetical protein [Bacteroidales bacterium]